MPTAMGEVAISEFLLKFLKNNQVLFDKRELTADANQHPHSIILEGRYLPTKESEREERLLLRHY